MFLENTNEAIRILTNIITTNKNFIKVGFKLWKLLYISVKTNFHSYDNGYQQREMANFQAFKNYYQNVLLKYSFYLIKICSDAGIFFSYFVKAIFKYVKALFLAEKYDDCIQLLINLLDLYCFIPVDNLKFLSEVNKKNNIHPINNIVELDSLFNFFSKDKIYKKSEEIFNNYNSYLSRPRNKSPSKNLNKLQAKQRILLTLKNYKINSYSQSHRKCRSLEIKQLICNQTTKINSELKNNKIKRSKSFMSIIDCKEILNPKILGCFLNYKENFETIGFGRNKRHSSYKNKYCKYKNYDHNLDDQEKSKKEECDDLYHNENLGKISQSEVESLETLGNYVDQDFRKFKIDLEKKQCK